MNNFKGLHLIIGWIGCCFALGFVWPYLFGPEDENQSLAVNTPAPTVKANQQINTSSTSPSAAVSASKPSATSKTLNSSNKKEPRPFIPGPGENVPNKKLTQQNPYIKLMEAQRDAREKAMSRRKASRKDTDPQKLDQTLESIRSGIIEPDKLERRNEYFEKLSKQLQDLQGSNNNSAKKEKDSGEHSNGLRRDQEILAPNAANEGYLDDGPEDGYTEENEFDEQEFSPEDEFPGQSDLDDPEFVNDEFLSDPSEDNLGNDYRDEGLE